MVGGPHLLLPRHISSLLRFDSFHWQEVSFELKANFLLAQTKMATASTDHHGHELLTSLC